MEATEFRAAREGHGWTQARMADEINAWAAVKFGKPTGYDRQRICHFEKGSRMIPPRVAWFISDAS